MQIPFYQTNQYDHFSSRFVSGVHRTNAATSLHSRRRMMEAQDAAQETESVRVTISGEAMALARQAKAMERLEQYANAGAATETDGAETGEGSGEPVQLTDEEIYDELLNQVNIWGDKSYALRHDFNHQETAQMAEKRAAALTEKMLAPRKHFIDIVAVTLNAGSIVLRNAAQLRADHDDREL